MATDRRHFILNAAALAAAASMPGGPARALSTASAPSFKYPNPGRLVIVKDERAVLGLNKVDENIVQSMFDAAITGFTGINSSPSEALASLFPGLTKSSRIAIKPNLINSAVPTRKELVKAVIRRLTGMLGGFPAENILLYERHSFPSCGYTAQYFGFPVKLTVDSSFPDLGYRILCDRKERPYSKTLHDADFLVNMPVLKDHGCSMNFTMAFKNHMGTVNPGGSLGICSNKRAVLDIMADEVMTVKQRVVIMDCLYAIINGGPGGSPQETPCAVCVSQDPVTNDYIGREIINAYRSAAAYAPKKGSYIEEAAADPYVLGVCDPAQMDVRRIDMTTGNAEAPEPAAWILSDAYPNPFSRATEFQLELPESAVITAEVYSYEGRRRAVLHSGPARPGTTLLRWSPSGEAPGMYLLHVTALGHEAVRKILYCP